MYAGGGVEGNPEVEGTPGVEVQKTVAVAAVGGVDNTAVVSWGEGQIPGEVGTAAVAVAEARQGSQIFRWVLGVLVGE